jgi:hypothetical protein
MPIGRDLVTERLDLLKYPHVKVAGCSRAVHPLYQGVGHEAQRYKLSSVWQTNHGLIQA